MIQDFKFALRQLIKTPGFTVIAVFTLALGIGANTAIFSVVSAVLLRPLPYANTERLVQVWGTQPQLATAPISPGAFLDWREKNQVFDEIAAYVGRGFNLQGSGNPERLRGLRVSVNLFRLLGVQPALGRAFLAAEDEPGRSQVVVLSHGLWQRRFGSDANLVGRTIRLDDQSYTVAGVMPAGFMFPSSRTELWTPMAFSPKERVVRDTNFLSTVGRLKPGVAFDEARTAMSELARQLSAANESARNHGVKLVPLTEQILGDIRTTLYVLLGAVAFVLLISCANVANLLFARTAERQKEIAIRGALGASQARVLRMFLTESVLLALLGGAFGCMLAIWGVDLLVALKPANLPRLSEIAVDGRVLGFTFILSLVTGLAFGVLPALHASRSHLNEILKEGGGRGASASPARQRTRTLLIVSELALSLVLLIGAALMMQSFARLVGVNPGFNPDHALTATVSLPPAKYKTVEEQNAFFQRLLARLEKLPGVQAAGAITDLPLYGGSSTSFDVEGRPSDPDTRPLVDYRVATPGYLRALGISLLKGRDFSENDNAAAPGVVIINETMARQFFPGTNPIGQRIGLSGPVDSREIIGVVGDVKNYGLDQPVKPEAYVPYFQNAPGYLSSVSSSMSLVLRTAQEPASLAASFTAQVQALDQDQPILNMMTLDQYLSESIAQRRFNMLLLGVFAALALILATVGIYGVIAYSVTQRSSEIGLRIALGASAGDILQLLVAQSLKTAAIGLAIGLVAAFALTRVMTSLLYEISATDPVTFAALTILLALVALAASYLPARRAIKVNPTVALRSE